MSGKFKKVGLCIFVLFAGICIAFLSVMFAYALPRGRVIEHVRESMPVLEEEGDYPILYKGFWGSRLDNYTDALYMQLCFIEGSDSLIDNTLSSYVLKNVNEEDSQVETPVGILKAYFDGKVSGIIPRETRFWNGYVVFLKPLLCFANYTQIRMLNLALQICLMCLLLLLARDRLGTSYVLPFLLFWIAQNPAAVSMNIFYSGILYSTLIPLIIMLLLNDRIKENGMYEIFFVLVGMETVFFNMNSSLIMPFGMCLILYYLMNGKAVSNFRESMGGLLRLSLAWLIGAFGLWSSKWVLASMLTDNYNLTEAIQSMLFRTSTNVNDEEITRIQAIKENCRVLWSDVGWRFCMLLYLAVIMCYVVWMIYKKRLAYHDKVPMAAFMFCLFAAIPFLWYGFMPNHSFIHHCFTYRTLSVGVFAAASLPLILLDLCSRKKSSIRRVKHGV